MFYRIRKRKKNLTKVTFLLPAEKATTTPILAQVIGQFGFNIQEFLVAFNKKSNIFIENTETRTIVYVSTNKKWSLFLNVPATAQYLRKVANIVHWSKIARISFFIKRKKIRSKFRYRLMQCKYWRGKMTLRHIYSIQQYIEQINNIEDYYTNVKNMVNLTKSTGMYLSKLSCR